MAELLCIEDALDVRDAKRRRCSLIVGGLTLFCMLFLTLTPLGVALTLKALDKSGVARLQGHSFKPQIAMFVPDRRPVVGVETKGPPDIGCGPDGNSVAVYRSGGVVHFQDGSIAGYWHLDVIVQDGETLIRP